MNKALIILSVLLVISSQAIAQEVSKKEKSLMKDIARNCQSVPDLKFPRPGVYIDRELQDFQDSEKYFKRDMSALTKLMPDAEQSEFIVWKIPFNQHVSICKSKIKNIRYKLDKEQQAKPNKAAQKKIKFALQQCQWANRWLDNLQKWDYLTIEQYYNSYLEARDAALSMDKRVASWNATEIEMCDTVFVPKFIALKKEKTKKNEAKKALQKAVEFEQQQKLSAIYKAKEARAVNLGYKGVYEGLVMLVDGLNKGWESLEDVKPYLVEPQPSDRFFVSSIVDDYVIYGYQRNSREYVQVAIEKEAGLFYGNNAPLPYGFYEIKGTNDFVSVLGARQQLIVLKHISE